MSTNGKKMGRPRKLDGRKKFTTKLRPETVELLREIGKGQANEGIERLAAAFSALLEKQGSRKGG